MTEMPSRLVWTFAALALLGSSVRALAEPPKATALIECQRKEESPVWADGDTATFYYRGPADEVQVIFGGDFRPLKRIAGSDVWTLAVTLPDLDQAVFSYTFVPTVKGRPSPMSSAKSGVWRGTKAPAAAKECQQFKGTLTTHDIQSPALGVPRKLTVYVPPLHDAHKHNSAIYAADGESIGQFARVLEPLITSGRVPPIVLIGVHSGGYLGVRDFGNYDTRKDLRGQEYFPGINPKRFADHESFFIAEVPAWAEKQFGVSSTSKDRCIFGYSNAGRFAVEMGLRHPEVFGHDFAFSVPGDGHFDFATDRHEYPHFELAAGTWETVFRKCTASLADQLRHRGAHVHLSIRVGGHDAALWRDEFAAAVVEAFGKK
jgi:enterochelin esterase-like enzyme